jgi:hypothetical protein
MRCILIHDFLNRVLPVLGIAAALWPVAGVFAETLPTQDNPALAWPPVTAQTRPWARWWWMGSAVDAANLDRELARYHAAGLGGVEVTPIYGVKGWEDRDIPYLSPKWMEMLNHAIATGNGLGMKTDMTTGTGWCFGGPTVTGSDANAVVVPAIQQVQAGGTVAGTFDPAKTQALVAFSPEGKCVELTGRIGMDGRVDWTAEGGPWTVYAISQKPSGVVVKRSAPGGAGPMLNPFFPDAMRRYMQWFEGPFAAAKPNLGALFQDSYEYKSQWAPDFFAQFEKLRGYRLQTELPALLGSARSLPSSVVLTTDVVGKSLDSLSQDSQDDHAARVKSDYRETISDIMTLESMPIWVQWAHDHGYLARYQAHGDPGNLLDLYGIADIPETEMILQNRSILVSKFASSAAHVTGKPLASSETGTWLTEHFSETLAEMKYVVDDMFLAGINHIIYHGTAYSPDEAAWPGWCFYASTEMNPRNSIWHDVPTLNEYVTRCQSVLQAGQSDNDVLVYWPIYDRWDDAQGLVQNFDIAGRWFETQAIGKTAHMLWDRGYAFDYVSDRQLAGMKAADGGIVLGGCKYRAIVVPHCRLMPLATLEKLRALAAGGIPVIFDTQLPVDVPGWDDLDNRRKEFQSVSKAILAGQWADLSKPSPWITGDVEAALKVAGVKRESMTDNPGIHFIRRSYPDGLHYFVSNRGAQALDGWVTLATKAGSIEVMDPMTGRTGIAQCEPAGDDQTKVYLQVEPGQALLLRTFEKTVETGPAWPVYAAGNPVELTGMWTLKFIDGGPTLPSPIQTGTLASWTTLGGADAQAFAGTAVYSLTFDAPPGKWVLDLGKVCQSARVRLNGKALGVLIIPPYRLDLGTLLPRGNVLEVEVTNVAANRVRDLDIRHVAWKVFYPPNVLSPNYKPLNASGWPLADSGLLGPVTLVPEIAEK